jgi:hypothetical protein
VKWDQGAYFLVGSQISSENQFWFCLNVDSNRKPASCYTHYAFTVDLSNFKILSQKIAEAGVIIFKDNTSPGNSLYFLDPDGHKLELHVGSWQQRIEAKKENLGNWENVEWYI